MKIWQHIAVLTALGLATWLVVLTKPRGGPASVSSFTLHENAPPSRI